jgi:hypothetical protein
MNDRQREIAIKVFLELLVGAAVFFRAAATAFIRVMFALLKIMWEIAKSVNFSK